MRAALALALLAAAGCSKKSAPGLPPAEDWNASVGAPIAGERPRAATPPSADPHAGLGIPPAGAGDDDPHAGIDMGGDGSDPHAGLDMGAMGGAGGDPHAGVDMSGAGGVDVTQLGLPPPDPDRAIDPSRYIRGVVKVAAVAKGRLVRDGVVFLFVKRAGADGQPSGAPLAVDRMTWTQDGAAFELTDALAMIGGTELSGDVFVMARYDQDADAGSRQPGDVTGQARVKIPAAGVQLVLDTVLP